MTDESSYELWGDLEGLGPRYFDRAGNPITLGRWMDLMHDWDYKRVRLDLIGDARVSTVWLGLDHRLLFGPPLIFETMISSFADGEFDDYQERYSSEPEAIAGHEQLVRVLREAQHQLERLGREIVTREAGER